MNLNKSVVYAHFQNFDTTVNIGTGPKSLAFIEFPGLDKGITFDIFMVSEKISWVKENKFYVTQNITN